MLNGLTTWLWDPSGLTPHGFCLLWEPGLLWLHALSDIAIGLAYFTIPFALLTFIRVRNDMIFRPVFGLFAAFILFCGAGHWLTLLTLWVPAYGLEGVVKAITAIVSILTAVAMWKLMPQALALPSPAQLREANIALLERDERAQALRLANAELEHSASHLADARDAAEELAKLRHYDLLTGLPNRRLMEDRLLETDWGAEFGSALLFLDLDRFKAVNDTMGHAAGDALLVEVALRLVAAVGADHMVARLGGDEFVVLCSGLGGGEVTAIGEKIRQTIEAPFEIAGRSCHISASIGIAVAQLSDGLDLVRAADIAMYVAKQGGGNRGVVFEPALFDRATQLFELEHDMRAALKVGAGEQFSLLYQPLFGVAGGQRSLVGFEALIRWRHPVRGWLSPALFIPMAEKSGLILPLGDWVLATALRQGCVFRDAYPDANLQMSVNVSPLQLSPLGVGFHMQAALEAEGFPPAALCVEVTESILTESIAAATLVDIRGIGVRVAIDDFGIGYSSLSYLRRLPADVVKLDRSFLEDVKAEASGDAFVGAVIALAHAAGKPVIFEGIETQEQFNIVLAAGADMVQGFFFGPPLSARAAGNLIAQHRRLEGKYRSAGPVPDRCEVTPSFVVQMTEK
jgi:diguanylate cyclase (GGDEF)-like protein